MLSDRLPLYEDGKLSGAVSIFRNRTGGGSSWPMILPACGIWWTPWAYTHEFMNKLHVILGLLQIGEPEKAQQYIMDTTRTQQEAVSRIMHQIAEPSVAALLVGKTSRANELGIHLTLDRESALSGEGSGCPRRLCDDPGESDRKCHRGSQPVSPAPPRRSWSVSGKARRTF